MYNCHAREDGKGEPSACYGRDLHKPSFQADDGQGCAVFALRARVLERDVRLLVGGGLSWSCQAGCSRTGSAGRGARAWAR
jgi:hypothetical protein